jgi:hypothetical protein
MGPRLVAEPRTGHRADTFAAAVYHVDHGENHCDKGPFGFARPYHAHLYDDFAISPSRSPRSTRWASFGLPALRPDLRLPKPAFLQPKSYLANYSPPATPVVPSQ